ncbi:hypothetical protein K1T71_000990 [Dendrolimus kikuchii]|uniref:Uncharacterized protein n=1 Tax=Dendrolimus kikuchii TaxID=765133 RepID=A0ACC1DGC5_9NEOP|nr:hypothetical protein K1T71_000990 [Dendrolimus kikuchii]
MKPLFNIVVTICLVVAATAHPENIEDVKQLPQTKEPVVEADEAQNHPRIERCSACAAKLHLNQPNFAALSQVGEVHTSQSFEGCSSENGCAGVKVKDGKVVEKFGNLDSFKNAISSDATKEFQFHAASALKNVFEKGIPGDGPFWWMNQNSPFKTSSSFQKYTSNSAYTSGSNDEGLSKNIFLNGQFAKGPSFNAGGANVNSGASSFNSGSANYHSSSSSFNSGSSSVNTASLSENPFLNGQLSSGFTGYTGSSPSPFTASTVGSNINLIQSSEKQYIQGASIDNGFANSGNVRPNENSGDLQQTCAGQGYVCVPRSQCNNGVVNTNGGYIPQANSQKQYCNVQREICCRVETTGTFGISTSSSGSSGFQTNIISGSSLDALSAGSALSETYRPGASGSNLKPGVPYLPPIDSTNSASNIVSSTRFPSTFLTTPRPVVSTLGYLPPSTSTAAPGYLPPQNPESTNQKETYVPPGPDYTTGSIYIDQFRQPSNPIATLPQAPSAVPAGCAAALKCTPIEYCTAEGVISNTTVSLTRDQASFRVPLTDCKDLETGRIGKCCRDPYYTDPWPVNQLGKWIPEAFGNTGKYVPDNGGSFSNRKIVVTSRPDTTGSTVLNVVRTSPTPITPSRIPVTTPKYQQIPGGGAYVQTEEGRYSQGGIGQYTETGGGSYLKQGVGQIGVGQIGVGVIGIKKGAQDSVSQGSFDIGTAVNKGIGTQYEKNNRYFTGQRNEITSGAGTIGVLGRGTQVTQGTYEEGKYGTRQEVIQGIVTGTKTGEGFNITPGREYVVENEFGGRSEESINRVFLQKLSGDGQCGLLNPQKPYGNKNNLEVDFAEIPWQAMVLLQTNKSLLCGGVITRPDVVVTSAACVDGLQAKNVLIKGGEWKLGVDDEPLPFQIVQVKHILRHPFYKRGSYHFDAAILVLTENLRLAKNIQPICLPSKESSSLDAFYNGAGECLVTGWGKVVLQSHLQGSIMHAINVSLLNPGECQSKLSSDYPHLLEYYDSESCVCGQPTNPINSICKVDIGSALACTTGDSHFVLRGVYSWDSDCQIGNQIAAFYKFDIEWYEWALGFIDSVRFGAGITVIQKTVTTTITTSQYPNRFNNIGLSKIGGATGFSSVGGAADVTRLGTDQRGFIAGIGGGVKNTGSFTGSITSGGTVTSEVNRQYNTFGTATTGTAKQITGSSGVVGIKGFGEGVSGFTGQGQFSQGEQLTGQVGVPITNTYTFTEKKIFQTEPKYITYTTKPEIVTFTTKPEYYTFTTKPKYITYTTKPEIVTYTTKPKIITYTTKPEIVTYTTKPKIVTYTTKPELVSYEYQTLGSRTNLQYAAPDVSSNPSFTEIVNHKHTGQCKCLENSGKK